MRKNTKFGINAIIITLVTIAAVILVNAVASTLADKLPVKFDLTQDKVYEFSDHTREIMSKLDKEINVYALYPANTNANQYITYAEEYLAKYEALNKNFKVTYIDPYTNPNFAKKYETQGESIGAGAVVLECGDKFRAVTMNEMYTTNSYTGSTSIDMERKITSAVMHITGQSGNTKVYFIEGHDEHSSTELSKALGENGYKYETINIGAKGIPDDAAMLIVLNPSKDLTAEERDMLDGYLDKGGRAMFAFEPGMPRLERLSSYLAEWGIVPRNDFIVENDSDHAFRIQSGVTIPAPVLSEHSITNNLISQKLVYMTPSAGSLELNKNNIRHAELTSLMNTTEKSWGKVNLAASTLEKEEGDNEGPLTVAALSEVYGENGGSIMVIGSLTAIELSGILQESSYANGDFILNSIGYLTQTDGSMDIRAKVISASSLRMSQAQVVITWVLLQYIIPLIVIIIGLVVWFKRRYK